MVGGPQGNQRIEGKKTDLEVVCEIFLKGIPIREVL
jgi:hypothetical protein